MTIYLNKLFLILIFICQISCAHKKGDNVRCKDNFIGIQFLDKEGDLVKEGTIGIFFPGIEENELSIVSERGYKLEGSGLTCLDRELLKKIYRLNSADTLQAFYLKGIGNYTPFEIPLSSKKITVKLIYHPKLPVDN